MVRDPYAVLGVAKDASTAEIKKAYRKLAKSNHPDLHPGDAKAEQTFKEISQANTLLGDADKRARYDAGEIDASGQERPQAHFHDQAAGGPGGFRYTSRGDAPDLDDLFANMFGDRGGFGAAGHRPIRGQDIRYALAVDFLDAIKGTKSRVTMGDGSTLDIALPKGLRDGQTIRLKGKGMPGVNGAGHGDALVTVSVRPHPQFRRQGDDIHLTLPVDLGDAVLGGKIQVQTVTGSVSLTIPENSNSGRVLRLKGQGVRRDGKPAGDQYVTLQISLPATPDPALKDFLRQQREKAAQVDEAIAA